MGRSISSTTGKDQVKPVTSNTGFDSGDLIYQTASDVGKIPDNFVSSDNFDAKQKEIRSVQNTTSSFNRKITVPDDIKKRFMGHGCPSAILSNGNIVTVYHEDVNGTPSASSIYTNIKVQIDQPDGTNVVPPFIINTQNTSYQSYENRCLSVVASSSGGFAVSWIARTNYYPTYAVCQNDGTVSVSNIQQGQQANRSVLASFNDGTYAIFYVASTNALYFQRFNSSGNTGGQVTISGNITYASNFDAATEPSGDVNIFWCSGNVLYRRAYNSAGTQQVNETVNSSPMQGSTAFNVAADISSTGKYGVMVAGNRSPEAVVWFSKDGAGGGWSALTQIGDISISPLPYGWNYVKNIPDTDNFLYTSDGSNYIVTQVIDYLGSPVGPKINNLGTARAQGARSLLKVGSELRYYISGGSQQNQEYRCNGAMNGQIGYVLIDPSTYTADGQNMSASEVVATTTAAVSGYSKAGSTPKTAKFLAASSINTIGQLPQTTSEATFAQTITSLGISARYIRGLELDNGKIAIAYCRSDGNHWLLILNSDYTVVSNTQLNTLNSTNGWYKIDIKRLANGNIIIVCPDSVDYRQPTARLYDSAMNQITGETPLNIDPYSLLDSNSSSLSVSSVPYQPTYFLVAYPVGGDIRMQCYDSTDMSNLMSGVQQVLPSSPLTISIVCDYGGNVYIGGSNSNNYIYRSYNTTFPAGTTWSSGTQMGTYGGAVYRRLNSEARLMASGYPILPAAGSSGQEIAIQFLGTSTSDDYQTTTTIGRTDDQGSIHGITGNGTFFYFNNTSKGAYPTSLWRGRADQDPDPQLQAQSIFSGSTGTYIDVGYCIPSKGDTAHIIFMRSTDSSHVIGRIRVSASEYVLATTAGVTPSKGVTLNSTTSPLLGVAATPCTAGGSAVVQVKGTALLNTNYDADTPSESFDFRSATADGVKGSISGRNVDLGD